MEHVPGDRSWGYRERWAKSSTPTLGAGQEIELIHLDTPAVSTVNGTSGSSVRVC